MPRQVSELEALVLESETHEIYSSRERSGIALARAREFYAHNLISFVELEHRIKVILTQHPEENLGRRHPVA